PGAAIPSSPRCRSAGVVSRHFSKPSRAAPNAASTSAAEETGASAYGSPVHGSTTGEVAPSAGSVYRPPTKLRNTAVVMVLPSPGRGRNLTQVKPSRQGNPKHFAILKRISAVRRGGG